MRAGMVQAFGRKNMLFESDGRAIRSDVTKAESSRIIFAWSKWQLSTLGTYIATRRTVPQKRKFPLMRRAITRARAKPFRLLISWPRLWPHASARLWELRRRTLALICAE